MRETFAIGTRRSINHTARIIIVGGRTPRLKARATD